MTAALSPQAVEPSAVSHSVAHHLMAISLLRESRGYARVSDVAKTLHITRGAASLKLKLLKARGLVVEDDNRFLALSPTGDLVAQGIRAKKALLERFFQRVLKVSEEQAMLDACNIEHLISDESAMRLGMLVGFLESGHPAAESFAKAFESWERHGKPERQVGPSLSLLPRSAASGDSSALNEPAADPSLARPRAGRSTRRSGTTRAKR